MPIKETSERKLDRVIEMGDEQNISTHHTNTIVIAGAIGIIKSSNFLIHQRVAVIAFLSKHLLSRASLNYHDVMIVELVITILTKSPIDSENISLASLTID